MIYIEHVSRTYVLMLVLRDRIISFCRNSTRAVSEWRIKLCLVFVCRIYLAIKGLSGGREQKGVQCDGIAEADRIGNTVKDFEKYVTRISCGAAKEK